MVDIVVKEGKKHPITLVYKDSDGFVIPLPGASAKMIVKKGYFKPDVIELDAAIDEPNGKIIFTVPAISTAGLLADKTEETYVYDIDLTEFGEEPRALVSGSFIVRKSTID